MAIYQANLEVLEIPEYLVHIWNYTCHILVILIGWAFWIWVFQGITPWLCQSAGDVAAFELGDVVRRFWGGKWIGEHYALDERFIWWPGDGTECVFVTLLNLSYLCVISIIAVFVVLGALLQDFIIVHLLLGAYLLLPDLQRAFIDLLQVLVEPDLLFLAVWQFFLVAYYQNNTRKSPGSRRLGSPCPLSRRAVPIYPPLWSCTYPFCNTLGTAPCGTNSSAQVLIYQLCTSCTFTRILYMLFCDRNSCQPPKPSILPPKEHKTYPSVKALSPHLLY